MDTVEYSDKVRKLQEKLYLTAKADPKRRFYSLRDKIWRADVLHDAWKMVRKNKGAPGTDGITISDIEAGGVDDFLDKLQRKLQDGSYRAGPVRRVYIDKPDGGQRPLGIPTVGDRVVQSAAKIVLEPIFEADFKESSFGYRPGLSCEEARQAIYRWLNFGCENVIDADIKGFFDNIPHDELMSEVERRISDRWVLKLIRAWLRAKVIEPDGRVSKPKKGTPQGGVISPLLANAYLNRLDTEWEARGMPDRWGNDAKLVRYADDLLILTSKGTKRPFQQLQAILERLGLKLHPDKTRVVKAEEGFDFLGFRFTRRMTRKHAKKKSYSFPSPKSMQRARERIRDLTAKRQIGWLKPLDVVNGLNLFLRGWGNYYRHSNASRSFGRIQHYANQKVRKFLRYRRQRKGFGYKEYPDSFLYEKLGLHNLTGGVITHA